MGLRLRSARFLGPFPRGSGPGWTIFGQDGAQSIDLGDGRIIFLFSDTLLAAHEPGLLRSRPAPVPTRFLHAGQSIFLPNCMAVAAKGTYTEALSSMRYLHDERGLPQVLLAAREREEAAQLRFWPEHGIRIGDQVYVYYLGIQTIDPTSNWGFRNAGAGLARMDADGFSVSRCTKKGDWRYWTSEKEDLHVGVCVVPFEDWVLVYCAAREELSAEARLMRVPPDRIEDPSAYEFLESYAPTWSSVASNGLSLGHCAPEYTVRYNSYLGKYVMLYVEGFTKTAYARLADRPWGPFGPPCPLLRVPSAPDVPLVYLGFEHPTFEEEGGARVFLSYCQPDFALNSSVRLTFM